MNQVKTHVCRELEKLVGSSGTVNVPPRKELGDYSSNIGFEYDNPPDAAKKIAMIFKPTKYIKQAKAVGPYVNFFLDYDRVAIDVIRKVLELGTNYGKSNPKNKKVMVEYSQPNTHKAFHVGHIRSTVMGDSIAKILEFGGYEVTKTNYVGDTGAHISKTLWAMKKFYAKETPPKNKGKWLGGIYRDACKKLSENPEYEKEVAEINRKLFFDHDPDLMSLWKKTRGWSLDEFDRIYSELGINFNVFFFESQVEEGGIKLVKRMVAEGIAKKDDGAVIVELGDELGNFLILRSDGTPLYATKDLYLAKKKFEKFKIDENIYVVGSEQSHYFKQVFATLKKMKFKQADACKHIPVGEVMLKSGKMKSREGEVILYEDFAKDAMEKALEAVNEKNPQLDEHKKQRVSKMVGFGAMKYGMIHTSNNKKIVFDINKMLDFNGETAPYIQYAYVRSRNILLKSKKQMKIGPVPEAIDLFKTIIEFPDVVERASEQYAPHIIAQYAYSLAYQFNKFYDSTHVIGHENEEALLGLVKATKITLKNSLRLLGIEAPNVM